MTVPGPGSSSNAARKAEPCRTAAAVAAVAVAERAVGVGGAAADVANLYPELLPVWCTTS